MATLSLTAQNRTDIEWIIEYQSKAGVRDVPLDQKVSDILTRIAEGVGEFGDTGRDSFREQLRDQPITTLLKVLLLATD